MSKKPNSIKPVPAPASMPVPYPLRSSYLLPLVDRSSLSHKDQRTIEHLQNHTTVISAAAAKTIIGEARIVDINVHALENIDAGIEQILEIKNRKRSKEHQEYMDEFCRNGIYALQRQVGGVAEIGVELIAEIVHRQLDLPKPPKPRGWW